MVVTIAGSATGAVITAVPAAATNRPILLNFLKNGGVSSPQRLKKDFNLSFNLPFAMIHRLKNLDNAQSIICTILQRVLHTVYFLEELDHQEIEVGTCSRWN